MLNEQIYFLHRHSWDFSLISEVTEKTTDFSEATVSPIIDFPFRTGQGTLFANHKMNN